jgi:hypothetical protein
MSRFPSFLEYLNDKGVVVDKPGVEQVPDYHGPDDKTPPGSKVPYKTPLTPKAAGKGEKGMSELGDDRLVYKPDTEVKYDTKKDVMKESSATMGGKARTDLKCDYKGKIPNAPKGGNPYVAKAVKAGEKPLGELGDEANKYEPDTDTGKTHKVAKTEGFVNRTKGMSLAEFTRYMLEECGCGQVSGEDLPYVTAYSTGKIQPHPPEAIRYVSTLANKNDGILENLVSTMVSMGYLNKLLKAIFEHPQAYEELTSLLSDEKDGPARCDSFVGSMNKSYSNFLSDQEGLYESVSGPIGFEDEMEDEEFGPEEEDETDSEEEFDSEDDEFGPEEEDEMDSDEEFDSEDDEFGPEEEDEMDSEGEIDLEKEDEMDSDEEFGPEEDHHGDEMEDRPRPRRLKKKFAHDNLLSAMKKHEFMMKAMRGE